MAKAWKITVAEEELCRRAVKATPKSTVIIGFCRPEIRAINAGVDARGAMAVFIRATPSNSIPNPMITQPMCLIKGFATNRNRIAPIKRIKGA